jgi:hypothetical protein
MENQLEKNEKLLRKLGKKELYMALTKNDYEKLVNVSKIRTQIDLSKSLDTLAKAIFEWKRLNPFLRSKIIIDGSELYFAQILNEDNETSLENVQVLSFDSDNEKDVEKYLIELLVEREMCTNFDLFKQLFWRIIFFKNATQKSSSFEYTIIFTAHHFCCEAKYKYLCLIELLNLIEDIHSERYVSNREPFRVLGALEDLFPMKKREHLEFSFPKMPTFIDMNEAKKRSIESEHYAKVLPNISNKWIKSHLSNQRQIAIEHLLENAVKNNSKFKFIKFEREKFERIERECKRLNIKLNGCLNMILVKAHKLFYDKYERKSIEKIHYFNSVSLRQFLNEDNAQHLFYLVSNFYKEHEFKSGENFWHEAKVESSAFHSRLNAREYLHDWKWSDCGFGEDEMCFDYFCANLGVLPASVKDKNEALIQVFESYDVMNIGPESRDGIVSVITSTIEKNLFISLMFNSFFITEECVDYLCESILNVMDSLFDQCE